MKLLVGKTNCIFVQIEIQAEEFGGLHVFSVTNLGAYSYLTFTQQLCLFSHFLNQNYLKIRLLTMSNIRFNLALVKNYFKVQFQNS